jgi:hypothetical protein
VDFILEKDGKRYAVEAKCWPAYSEGRLKKLSLSNIQRVRKGFRTPFLEGDFLREYKFEGRGMDGKILAWWDFEESEAEGIKDELRLDGLVSLKRALDELEGRADVVGKYKEWADQLFSALLK